MTNCMRIKESLNSARVVHHCRTYFSFLPKRGVPLDFAGDAGRNISTTDLNYSTVDTTFGCHSGGRGGRGCLRGERRRWVLCRPREEEYEMRMR